MKNVYYLSILSFCLGIFSAKAQQTCYTISDSENKVYKFKLSDGTILDSKSLSSLSSPEASTLNLDGDTMFILNADQLHYIDFNSSSLANTKISGSDISSQKLTGALGDKYISDFDAMSVDTAGNIWAGSSNNNPCLMVVIDQTTGQVKEDFFGAGVDYIQVQNGSWSALRFDAMAFDPLTNELYANMNGTSQNYDYLFKLDKTNGNMTLVRQFNTINDVEGMAFDAVGDLYVTTGSNASSSSIKNTLWHVDLLNGEVTKKFSLWGGDMETCDCVIGEPITAVALSGYVFFDADEDTLFNSGDVGKSGYLINVYKDANGNGVYDQGTDVFVDSTRTYADGFYEFRLGYTSGTEKYVIVSDTNDLPDNAFYTTDNIETAVFTAGLQTDENNNFGFSIDSSSYFNIISGTVFADKNEDTTFNVGEDGVSGVKVRLYQDKDCDGVLDNSDVLVDSTIVGMDGEYKFIRPYSPSTGTGTSSISKRIVHKYDDAEEDDGDMSRTSSDLDLGEEWVGLRFQSITVPQGATITDAYIQFTAEDNDNGSAKVKIYGEDENDADQYSSSDDDITDRTKTSEKVTWNMPSWTTNTTYNTPDLTDIVQEIVDRGGWLSGNDMAFIIKPENGDRDAYTYDASTSKAPLLFIEWEDGTTSSTDDCYITNIDETTKPAGSHLTTDNIEKAQFSSGGNHDSLNNFGLWGGSLPVEWLTFDGKYLGEDVLLNWSTAMEENNSHFVVERSADGLNWEAIGDEIPGAGFSNEILNYTFLDEDPFSTINYYRVKQVDFDGKFSYTHVIVLEKKKTGDIGMVIFPNPATDFANVKWAKDLTHATILLMDIKGNVLREVETNSNEGVEIDLSNFDRGIYLIEIRTQNERFTKRLIHN